MNIKSVIFGVKKDRISKLLMSTVFSTLMANSFNIKHEKLLTPVLPYSNAEFDKFQSKYNFGVDENLSYASLINRSSDEIQNEEKSGMNGLNDETGEIKNTKLIKQDVISTKNNNGIIEHKQTSTDKTKPQAVVKSAPISKAITKEKKSSFATPKNDSKKSKQSNKNVKKCVPQSRKSNSLENPVKPTNVSLSALKPNTKVVNGQTYTIQKTISGGNATAYSTYGKTSTGCTTFPPNDCYCVAVDPQQIPYFSDILIEFSDGKIVKGKALDTGSALRSHYKGVVVDLYMKTESECRNFGRRNVTVYVV